MMRPSLWCPAVLWAVEGAVLALVDICIVLPAQYVWSLIRERLERLERLEEREREAHHGK